MLNTLQYWTSQHQRLSELRIKLLHLHKLLLDTERLTYEQVRGQVSRGELLQLVISHEQFAWLHRLSELIIQIDELLHADESVTSEAIEAIDSDIPSPHHPISPSFHHSMTLPAFALRIFVVNYI